MRSPLSRVSEWFVTLLHPAPGVLVMWIDGELDASRSAQIKKHLEHCSVCRTRLEQIDEGLRFFNHTMTTSSPQFPVEQGLAKLTATIRTGQTLTGDQTQPGAAMKSSQGLYARLLSELSIYLGPHTAMEVLARCDHGMPKRERLSAEIEPVVVAFLGKHTGTAVLANVLRIWDCTQQVAS